MRGRRGRPIINVTDPAETAGGKIRDALRIAKEERTA
jgi:hypothetical protein